MLEVLRGLGGQVFGFFAYPFIQPFHLPFDVFSFALCIRLSLPHPLDLKVTHCICGEPLNVLGTHLSSCSHGGEWTTSHDAIQNAFVSIAKKKGFLFHINKPMSTPPPLFPLILSLTSWHHLINWWHSHLGGHGHCRSHQSRFGLSNYLIS